MRARIAPLILMIGCDPLAGSGYVGEPIFSLSGTFDVKSNAPQDPGAGIALMWQDSAGANGPGVAATVVPVTVEVPASFRVAVPVLPPPEARFAFGDGGPELAEAYVFLVADPSARPLVPRGVDRRHALVYAAADVADGTQAAAYLGGPVAAGYHLRQFSPATMPPPAQQSLVSRCVTGGSDPAACQVRRAYALGPIADDDPLTIVVSQ